MILVADYDALENRKSSQRGLTLIELIVSFTLLLILSTIALPLARVQMKRTQEGELRRSLREIRTAIDRYRRPRIGGSSKWSWNRKVIHRIWKRSWTVWRWRTPPTKNLSSCGAFPGTR